MTIGVNSAASALIGLNNLLPSAGSGGSTNAASALGSAASASTDSVVLDAAAAPSDRAALIKFIDGLNQSTSSADAARGSGQAVLSLLKAVKGAAAAAADPAASDADRAGLQQKVQTYLRQIQQVVQSAGFKGVNLLDNSQPSGVQIGSGLTLGAQDLTLGGANIPLTASSSVASADAAGATLSAADAAIGKVTSALSSLDSQISGAQDLADQLSGLAGLGGAAPPSDVSGDGARLLALQIRQEISSGGALAGGSQLGVLNLFR